MNSRMIETLVGQRNETYPEFIAGKREEKIRESFGFLFPPSSSQVPPMLGGVGQMIDSGCPSWGPVSFWAVFPCLWPSVKGLVFPWTAGGPLACYAWQAPRPSLRTAWVGPSQNPSAMLGGLCQRSVRLVCCRAVGVLHSPRIDWTGESRKLQGDFVAKLCTQTLFTKGVLDLEVIKKMKLVHLSIKMMPIIVFMPLSREPQRGREV